MILLLTGMSHVAAVPAFVALVIRIVVVVVVVVVVVILVVVLAVVVVVVLFFRKCRLLRCSSCGVGIGH